MNAMQDLMNQRILKEIENLKETQAILIDVIKELNDLVFELRSKDEKD